MCNCRLDIPCLLRLILTLFCQITAISTKTKKRLKLAIVEFHFVFHNKILSAINVQNKFQISFQIQTQIFKITITQYAMYNYKQYFSFKHNLILKKRLNQHIGKINKYCNMEMPVLLYYYCPRRPEILKMY